jgi:hypothetical protein
MAWTRKSAIWRLALASKDDVPLRHQNTPEGVFCVLVGPFDGFNFGFR